MLSYSHNLYIIYPLGTVANTHMYQPPLLVCARYQLAAVGLCHLGTKVTAITHSRCLSAADGLSVLSCLSTFCQLMLFFS